MNVLILGGSGFIGTHLTRRLARDGHQVTVATRYAPNARHLQIVPQVRVYQLDPHNPDQLASAVQGHDAAVNLVGILNQSGFGDRGFQRVHVELVEGLIEACAAAGVGRLVQMSSLNAGQGESHYLRTRGQGETRVLAAHRDGRTAGTIVRASTVFGPDDSFLNRFADLLRISPVLPLARGQAKFTPVYVGDVAEALTRILDDPETAGRTFELGGAETWTLVGLVRWLRDQLGLKRAVFGLPDALGRLQGMAFDLVPGKPFSSDNFKSLKLDSVCSDKDFEALGIQPWGMTERAVGWLGPYGRQSRLQRYRRQARREQG